MADKKVLVANIRGPQGAPGVQGEPGALPDIQEVIDTVEQRVTDMPDLTMIFENRLV